MNPARTMRARRAANRDGRQQIPRIIFFAFLSLFYDGEPAGKREREKGVIMCRVPFFHTTSAKFKFTRFTHTTLLIVKKKKKKGKKKSYNNKLHRRIIGGGGLRLLTQGTRKGSVTPFSFQERREVCVQCCPYNPSSRFIYSASGPQKN